MFLGSKINDGIVLPNIVDNIKFPKLQVLILPLSAKVNIYNLVILGEFQRMYKVYYFHIPYRYAWQSAIPFRKFKINNPLKQSHYSNFP